MAVTPPKKPHAPIKKSPMQAMVEKDFPAIPDPAEVIERLYRLRTQHEAKLKDGQNDGFSESGYKNAAAQHFMSLAQANGNEKLGIDEKPGGNSHGYDYTSKAHVRDRMRLFRDVLKGSPDFFEDGFNRSVIVEGLAVKNAPNHTEYKKTFKGITGAGPGAIFDAYMAGGPGVARQLAATFPSENGYNPRHMAYTGADFYKNALAVHVQKAIFYTQRKPMADALALLGDKLLKEEKASLLAIGNVVPYIGLQTAKRLGAGEKLENIPLESFLAVPGIREMAKTNPRVFMANGRPVGTMRDVVNNVRIAVAEDGLELCNLRIMDCKDAGTSAELYRMVENWKKELRSATALITGAKTAAVETPAKKPAPQDEPMLSDGYMKGEAEAKITPAAAPLAASQQNREAKADRKNLGHLAALAAKERSLPPAAVRASVAAKATPPKTAEAKNTAPKNTVVKAAAKTMPQKSSPVLTAPGLMHTVSAQPAQPMVEQRRSDPSIPRPPGSIPGI